jgi:hypothetical protein
LHVATAASEVRIVKYLLRFDANVFAVDNEGRVAISSWLTLLQGVTPVDLVDRLKDFEKKTALKTLYQTKLTMREE